MNRRTVERTNISIINRNILIFCPNGLEPRTHGSIQEQTVRLNGLCSFNITRVWVFCKVGASDLGDLGALSDLRR